MGQVLPRLRAGKGEEKNGDGQARDAHCHKAVAGNSQGMGADYYADNAGGINMRDLSKEKTLEEKKCWYNDFYETEEEFNAACDRYRAMKASAWEQEARGNHREAVNLINAFRSGL